MRMESERRRKVRKNGEKKRKVAVEAQKLLLMTAMLQYKTIHFTSPRNTHTKSLLMFYHR